MKRQLSLSIVAVTLMCLTVLAQESAQKTPKDTKPATTPRDWTFYASVLGYFVPEAGFYASPVFQADRKALHIEARYNYENLETGSIWVGRNFSFGNKVKVDLTPMIGGVFGKSNGVAPGYLASIQYRRLTVDSQGEYLFEAHRAESFFYTWSEISYSPVDWFRAGIVVQRTKAYQTKLDTQRGVLAGFSYKSLDVTTYVFNIGWTDPTTVIALGYRF